MAVQKKHCDIPPSQGPLSTRTIESQKKRNGFERTGDNGGYIKPNSQAKKTACSVNKAAEICNTAPRATAVANGLNVDERLKAARERRQEHQKLLVFREQGRLEREQRARRYYEQQLQERKKKLQDQRLREERKRAAVEEKRKQRLKEEKERYESAVRRTVEKSQKVQQSLGQYSRGRKLTKNVPRRLPLTTWEKNLVNRLLTPTYSYLARSKSAGCQSGDQVSFHSMNSTTTTPHKPQPHSGSAHHWPSPSPRPNNSQHRSINLAQITTARQQDTNKKNSNTRSPAVNTSLKPAKDTQSRTTSPSPKRTLRRSVSRHSTPLQLELPPVPEEDGALCSSALSPGNSRPVRTSHEGQRKKTRDENPPEAPCSNLPDKISATTTRTAAGYRSPPQTPPHPAPQPPEVTCRPSAGTSDPGEASRLLAEKRREARLQREREEQERLQREEAERRSREELERKRADERARQQAEAQRLIEEKMRREEEEQRKAEEERAQAMREATLLQKQREEEQAREKEKAEQMKQEREILAQKEEAARQARKKRLEEIMRRTRRTDSPDTKSVPVKILPNEAQPKENNVPVHNGTIEDVVKLPVGTKTSQLGLNNEEDMVPVVAFKERRSLRTLTGLEEIQTHQRAEVI
ncbi:ensconsin [Perca flavescens]|uniref:ensconsin n=1 Tax=Perca flavescens TaxID=8167 RepID=UPI00106EA401|nr:ensconsin-like [Perca flavescens]XP_028420926.1 ensconsin-like [Perca flavescens]XP_028420927.1 ensconsin-like [Perca flavescens]XP_028420928.1 ensconsin-like [Perca flavescens]